MGPIYHRLFPPQSPLLAALFQTIGKAEYGLRSLLKTLHPKDSEIKSLATNDTWPASYWLRGTG